MNTFPSDIKFACRQLIKNPGFTVIAVLSLAIGIGAGTAVFSLVNAILLRSLPVPNPHELRVLHWPTSNNRIQSLVGSSRQIGGREAFDAFSHPAFLTMREACAGKADVFAFHRVQDLAAKRSEESFVVDGAMVSDNFFPALNVQPFIGHCSIFSQDHDNSLQSVVVSYDWWQRHFAGDREAIGSSLNLNGLAFTIVGVLPRGFRGLEPGAPWDVYVPMSARSPLLRRPLSDEGQWFAKVMARIPAGVNNAVLKTLLSVAFAREVEGILERPDILLRPGHSGLAYGQDSYSKPLLIMLGIVALVIIAACANVAGLMLSRTAARTHELSIRAALGASKWRLFHQTLTESLVVAFLGGVLGILLAFWWRLALARLLGVAQEGLHYDITLDVKVLGFSLAMVLAVALLAGILPAWWSRRTAPGAALKHRSAAAAPRLRTGRALVGAQISLSLLLVLGATIFVRTLVNLTQTDAGFRVDNLLVTKVTLRGGTLARNDPAQFYDRAQASIVGLPGVEAAAYVYYPLLANVSSSSSFSAFKGRKTDSPTSMRTLRLTVSESFFDTADIPIYQGRGFTAADTGDAAKVVVVNEAFVRSFLPNDSPIGLSFYMQGADWRIIGVCRDAKYGNIKEDVKPTTYFPLHQMLDVRADRFREGCLLARTALPPLALSPALRGAIAEIDPGVVITDITTQAAIRDGGIRREKLLAILSATLAGMAVLLSCIGVYGLTAFNVTRRTSEIGVRMALGATPGNIARPILLETVKLALLGILASLPLAISLLQLVKSQLYGIPANDPGHLLVATLALLLTAVMAAWIPSRRAVRVDPIEALRHE